MAGFVIIKSFEHYQQKNRLWIIGEFYLENWGILFRKVFIQNYKLI
jgi:hypothetical protein